jgi:arylsulfatase A-like enzyme
MNTIVIIVDDLGWKDVGYHASEIPTPNIDYLAKNGIEFNRFYASNICTPTRASLLTGLFSYKLGQQTIVWPWNEGGLTLDKKLIPQYLNNIDSYCIGKWNLGHTSKKYQPKSRGFIKHYGNLTGSTDHYSHTYYDVSDYTEDGFPIYPKGHTTDLLTNKTIEIIQNRNKNKDFFIYLAYNAPHVPLKAPQEYINKFKHINDDRRLFCAMVNHLDDSIGKIIEQLKKEKLFEDTAIWFTSDNGGWIGFGGNNGNLRGGKIDFYEGGVRVVNFMHCPKITGSKKDNQPRHVVDILPTMLKLNDQEYDQYKLDGIDIFCEDTSQREIVHGLYPTKDGGCVGSIMVGKHKLIKGKDVQIYDLEQDPLEKNNLSNNLELKNKLLEIFNSKKKDYLFTQNFPYYQPNGYPPGYKFPKWWGQRKNSKLKILSQDDLYFDENKSFREIMGYDVFYNG